jgi:hypothetical protein
MGSRARLGRLRQKGVQVSKANFRQRRRELMKQHKAITDQLDQIECERRIPLNDNERNLVARLYEEEERIWDFIRDLEEPELYRPAGSLDDIIVKLEIVTDREGLAQPMSYYLGIIKSQIAELARPRLQLIADLDAIRASAGEML